MHHYIKSGLAMADVLVSWGVRRIYGIPGGSINTTLQALYERRGSLRYIQVRHEECGALAASAEAKLTGKIGVCFGSAGPGATHLYNGLYDANMDKVPVLALIGQVASTAMNLNSFQEQNEDPLFADVAVYNRVAMSPQSLPFLVDEAIRTAYRYNGVACVTIPVDYGYADIPDDPISSAANRRTSLPIPDESDIAAAVRLIEQAERPVLYIGQGTRGAADEVMALSEQYSMPIIMSVLAKGIVPDAHQNLLGSAARVATKPANEALAACDLIVFIGSDFPFARLFFPPQAKFIQVDIDPRKLGRRHHTDVAILGDAKQTMRQMLKLGAPKPPSRFLQACRENMRNWRKYLFSLESKQESPLYAEAAFREINRIAREDAVFVTDVGNVTIHAIRNLMMNGTGQRFTTSGLFATMGYAVPGSIAAKLAFPDRQVFSLSGDGAFAMVMQDIATQVRYKLPIINLVFSNDSLGFIESEQEDTGQPLYGVDLAAYDFAAIGEAMGAQGYRIDRPDQLAGVFDAVRNPGRPVVIDVKIANKRPFPAEEFILDPSRYAHEEIAAFASRYEVGYQPVLEDLLR